METVIIMQAKLFEVLAVRKTINLYLDFIFLKFYFRYLKDFFTSMIDLPWSWTLLSFAASFYLSWVLFAFIWYILLFWHGE